MQTGSEKLAETVLGHPFCASEMRCVDARGAVGFGAGRDAEQRLDDLLPMSSGRIGVEQTQIELQMGPIVSGQCCAAGRLIEKVKLGHGIPRCSIYPFWRILLTLI